MKDPDSERVRQLEKNIREAASFAVAHLRRGEPVTITTTGGERMQRSGLNGSMLHAMTIFFIM